MVSFDTENFTRDLNLHYNRQAAKRYAEKYALIPNTKEYPYFEQDDCTNFVSQVLKAGGMQELGKKWDAFEEWFCNTKNCDDLTQISITWRVARYFRKHWANENGIGVNRAAITVKITVQQALNNFNRLYVFLKEGDIIQYGDPNNNLPYHTQIIHDKGFNWMIYRYDIFMAQHTSNSLYVSLYGYLSKFNNKDTTYIYIYKIKDD
ncbi:amidase domain-containing protein [Clostridium aestuarii]|uniref:Amidase domain-containing protein n=1 Tax=Clostridium aestuarii TaxID=338193 RepID=A0ABT4D1Z0_9CLOT|nr:amidase domain-containing protein [Clostridium aestuarii]MCY6485269.1 amidase domain-containing protein [Clostridium aestuarii]